MIPFAAYLPADALGLSGVLAAVAAGLVIGGRLGKVLTARSRVLWLSTWKMIGFVLNGFVFLLIGLELPVVAEGLGGRDLATIAGSWWRSACWWSSRASSGSTASAICPARPERASGASDPRLAKRLTFIVSWSGLRGAVSLAAALALPPDFPERNVILLVTFIVILVTLVGQGATLPWSCGVGQVGTAASSTAMSRRSRGRRHTPRV